MDFYARLVEVFDRSSVTFVSITQSFNTTTSMGRLTLNNPALLCLAQIEREVIGGRIRDKVAASRLAGVSGWVAGHPLATTHQRSQADHQRTGRQGFIRSIFLHVSQRSTPPVQLVEALASEGTLNKQGKPIDKGYLYPLDSQ